MPDQHKSRDELLAELAMLRDDRMILLGALEAQQDVFFLFEPHTQKALRWNRVVTRMTGYTDAEIAELPVIDGFFSPDEKSRAMDFVEAILERGEGTIEIDLICKDGRRIPMEYSVAVVETAREETPVFIAVGRDVSVRKHAEESLKESERRLATLMSNLPGVAYRCRNDADWTMLFLSDGVRRVTGYDAAALLDNSERSYNDLIHPDDQAMVWDVVQEALAAGTSFRMEYRIIDSDGVVRWVLEQGRIVGTESDGTEAIEGYITDISELKRLEQQFLQSQKMEAVGRLAGGVAHDFNNILMVVNTYCGMILSGLAEGDPLRDDVGAVRTAAGRATELTRQLLAFSRKQIIQPRSIDLNRAVTGSESMLRRLIGEDIEIVTEAAPEPLNVLFDPGQFEQVLFNLAVNARDAMPEGGRLTLSVARTDPAPADRERLELERSGPHARLAVSDTGHGMDAETCKSVFEPFFTTKTVGKGTGLGLSTVYGIVRQHGGAVEVDSSPGEGTTFTVLLPLTADPALDASEPAESASPKGEELVLLVEDDLEVRAVTARLLGSLGYAVRVVSAPGEAEAICRDAGESIDLVLTDVVMPGMSGRELADRIRAARPELPVLFMSGHTENAIVNQGVLEPGTAFLQKPFGRSELARALRKLLDG